LEAVYDGPFDTRNNSTQPVILSKTPTLADGDALYQAMDVKAGDEVVDASGALVALAANVTVMPSGCTNNSCAVAWDGSSPLKMDQLNVTFNLLPGLKWSDGEPLTAADSVYSFQVASDPATPVVRQVLDRTAAYTAKDDVTVQWTGVPGYTPEQFDTLFWTPLPKHLYESVSAANLLTQEDVNRKPLGWGPYVVDEWTPGDHISLSKNPNYFRAAEGLPKFDKLVFRFIGEQSDTNLAALLTGECDVVDQNSLLDEQISVILDLQKNNKLKAYFGQGPDWEHLDFGIKPVSYDDAYNPYGVDRPNFFGDQRVRQAFAYCINRQGIVDEIMMGQSSVPGGYAVPGSPSFLSDLAALPHDTAAGLKLLDEVGWKDLDGNPDTPLKAAGVQTIPDGTDFIVNYVTTEAPLRKKVAEMVKASLADCGVDVNISYSNPGQLYAQGPEGVLFGRQFDLAQFSWQASNQSPCFLYETSQIPVASNNWLSGNITGYSNSAFDTACQLASSARPDGSADYLQKQADVQRLFAQELPSIPLYFEPKVMVSRPDLCGLEMDVFGRSALSKLESFDYGSNCPAQ
jgi:peptide/nickel transport system substrate-binding protein